MEKRAKHVPELLAPAGSPTALIAAVNNGADAVYAGLGALNARRGAENFTAESLAEGCRFAHLRGTRVYLTANVLVHDREMDEALGVVASAWEAGVDAVIVQDLGFLTVLRTAMPEVRVHASTQLNAHNLPSIRELAERGVSRVTLARETSIQEIAGFASRAGVEVESFVHGSLCYCYSGQCLLSSAIGGRSANRGLCAQPCRLPYELVDENGHVASSGGRYLLSPKDLAGITVLPALVASGVAALKIEGRMKSPEYVALVVRAYRSALDRAVADAEAFEVAPAEWSSLEEAFSRGFSEAYLSGIDDESMMSRSRPNNRGVPLGRVVGADADGVTIALEKAAESEDMVQFWTSAGGFSQKLGSIRIGSAVTTAAPAGARVKAVTEKRPAVGDRVFRIANASLLAAARRTFEGGFEQSRPVGVGFGVRLRIGEPLVVEVSAESADGGAAFTRAEGPVVEAARTKPITAGEVMEHVGRLGGSGWRADSWDIEIDPAAGIGYSALHHARRDALAALERELLAPWNRRVRAPEAPGIPPTRRRRPDRPEIVVLAEDLGTLAAAMTAGADRGLLDVTSCLDPMVLPPRVTPVLPRIAHDDELTGIERWFESREGVVAGNLGVMSRALEAGARVEADWSLNALNTHTVNALADRGASLVWLSPELSGRGIAEIVVGVKAPVGVLAFGRMELMVAEHCALQAGGECSGRCVQCARRRRRWSLRDQKGYEFPVTTDTAGRTHVYNSVPLDLTRALPEVLAAGVEAVRLEFRQETPQEAARLTAAFVTRMRDAIAGREASSEPLLSPATSGHFFRGVR